MSMISTLLEMASRLLGLQPKQPTLRPNPEDVFLSPQEHLKNQRVKRREAKLERRWRDLSGQNGLKGLCRATQRHGSSTPKIRVPRAIKR